MNDKVIAMLYALAFLLAIVLISMAFVFALQHLLNQQELYTWEDDKAEAKDYNKKEYKKEVKQFMKTQKVKRRQLKKIFKLFSPEDRDCFDSAVAGMLDVMYTYFCGFIEENDEELKNTVLIPMQNAICYLVQSVMSPDYESGDRARNKAYEIIAKYSKYWWSWYE